MLRLAGVFPDLFRCSACGKPMDAAEPRHLARGLQTALCVSCAQAEHAGVHPEVPPVLHWILKNRLESGAPADFERGTRNLRELNQYWIGNYFER
jgi:recombinational DNA repair protein (RecF pathway)